MQTTQDTVSRVASYLAGSHPPLIDGQRRPAFSGNTFDTRNPATGEVIAAIQEATSLDVDLAVEAARAALNDRRWTGLSADARARVLWRYADLLERDAAELARLEVLNNGMPIAFANWMVSASAQWLRYYAGATPRIHGRAVGDAASDPQRRLHAYTVREPVGVASLILPWNGPIGTFIMKVAPALAAGCSCIVKPAENTPLTALRLGELAMEAGIPPGVLNILPGFGPGAGAALVAHRGVDKVSFTGSTLVGKQIVRSAADNLKRITLELGGKSPCIILEDADLETAIPAAAMGIFANSGQVCFAGSRLYVHQNVYDRVVAGIADFAAHLKIGSGLEPDTMLGPLISARQQSRVEEYLSIGGKEAETVCGGTTLQGDGYFVRPTVFANPATGSRLLTEEIFGPVLVAVPFTDLDAVVSAANDTRYGLGAGIFSNNINRAHQLAARLQAGNVWVNCYGVVHETMPFGGYKESGWGREMGTEGMDAFLETKSVFIHLPDLPRENSQGET